MLLLCSNGLTSENLQSCVKQFGGRTSALVVTADPEYKEENYHAARSAAELKKCGLTVDLFDVDFQPAEDLLLYDVVEFIGGNPYYLLHALRKCKAKDILKKIAEKKCLIGWSAGALVMGPTIEIVNVYSPEMNLYGLTDLTGMALTDIQILPHYTKFQKRYDLFEERLCKYESDNKCRVVRLDDGEGIIINGNNAALVK